MMKGALLVLTLLVTRELAFNMPEVEACPVFYGGVASLLLGSKTLLNSTLDLVDSTDEEKAAFGKIQDCFNEEGFDAKLHITQLLDSLVVGSVPVPPSPTSSHASVTFSENCSGYKVSSVVNALIGFNSSLLSMVT
ncbi:unnamed protein product [Rangifer tarandus platyrhynchus]|uniref:Uncharacterized protein n=1 Tax=Rangifer tarandus platyrhynchus TaxID=3082113 RepID=A0ABN8YMF5_RANTA|nr:unnamed protein product [Rangifer tarandus platyrhynchus]